MYTMKGKEVDEESLESSKQLLKSKVSAFSYFRQTAYLPIAAKPTEYEQVVNRTQTLYKKIKKEHPFLTSARIILSAL